MQKTLLSERGDEGEVGKSCISSDNFSFRTHHQVMDAAHHFRQMGINGKKVTGSWRVFSQLRGEPGTADFMQLPPTDMESWHPVASWEPGEIMVDGIVQTGVGGLEIIELQPDGEPVLFAFLQRLCSTLGAPAILVNNAGMGSSPAAAGSENGRFEDYPEVAWDTMIEELAGEVPAYDQWRQHAR